MVQRLKDLVLKYWPILVILIVFAGITLPRLGRDEFLDWDECIFSQQAKEMRLSNNFITNQWNKVLLFEKPPLTNWIITTFYSFGTNEFTARLPALIASCLILLFIYIFAKKYFNERVAVISSLLLLTLPSFITYSWRINSDIFFTLFTFIGFFLWLNIKKEHQRWSYVSGLFFGLAVMSKGLSIFPYIFVLFLTIFFDYHKWKIRSFFNFLAIFLLVIVPWHVLQYLLYGREFFQVYIMEHLIRRSQVPLDFHNEGRLFYTKFLLKEFNIWLIFGFLLPLSYVFKRKLVFHRSSLFKELKDKRVILTVLLIILIPFLAINQVRTRIWWYVLPLFPFIVLYLAYNIDLFLTRRNKVIFIGIVIIISILGIYRINKEINPLVGTHGVSPRNAVFKEAQKYKENEINYLVWFAERQARDILPKDFQTSTTFVFGGNPCAVYYSDKHINYIYKVEDFEKSLQSKKGLYVIENGDSRYIENMAKVILYKNSDFTLFRI